MATVLKVLSLFGHLVFEKKDLKKEETFVNQPKNGHLAFHKHIDKDRVPQNVLKFDDELM